MKAVLSGILSGGAVYAVLIGAWVAYCQIAYIRKRRKRTREMTAWPGLPRDGRPLDRYEAEKFLDVISDSRHNGRTTA